MGEIDTSGISASVNLREMKKARTRDAIHDATVRLVRQYGLAGVTIEQICIDANVSARTFFNYFPSKAAAATRLAPKPIPPAARAAFVAGRGDLVSDLCDLAAWLLPSRTERLAVQDLVATHPELLPAALAWAHDLHVAVVEVARTRAAPEHARLAAAVVLVGMRELTRRGWAGAPEESSRELRGVIAELGVIALTRD